MDNKDSLFDRLRFRGQPVANPGSIITCGQARFSILMERLIRLEWSQNGVFEDRSTYAFPTRYAPIPVYETNNDCGQLQILSPYLRLQYKPDGQRFTNENLSISLNLNGDTIRWTPGMPDPSNLRGTRRTLDGCAGDASLDPGLVSRAGWAVFDDSRSVLFNRDDGWVSPRPDQDLQDWYFFAYGHDYKAALAEYMRFGGSTPLIPRFVLGAWWSRFWAYSAQDLKDLVHDYEKYDLPLDVLVVDMDWHTPHSWTGYTWNRDLFPEPEEFLNWVHAKGLHTTLNLHPAQGVQPFEEIYPEFARRMAVNPASGAAIPFRIADKLFVKNYFELLHHPMEAQGVDFWWLDWQQGDTTEMSGLDALPWLNHLHFMDIGRDGKRSMLYSRWGGLGNHRYPIGFSGDTLVGWRMLQFQPYMTATAANVGYGWWSHDIGGHMGGATEPELYARWVQFGALSPCLRLHSTKDERCERRPWAYPPPVYRAAQAAFHLRYRLIPYIYSQARVSSDTGLAFCHPLYYEYPEEEAAYLARYQYFFGGKILAAPIVFPADSDTGLASVDVWVPEGEWIDFQTKEQFIGPRWVRIFGGLDRIPMLVRAGTIIPLAPDFTDQPAPLLASGTTAALPQDHLVLDIFPGKEGDFRLYEDDGASQAYTQGEYEWTEIRAGMPHPGLWELHIGAAEGNCPVLPASRSYQLRFEAIRKPSRVLVDGREHKGWRYEAAEQAVIVDLPQRSRRQPVDINLEADKALTVLDKAHNQLLILADARRLLHNDSIDDLDAALQLALQEKNKSAIARLGGPFASVIEFTTPEEAARSLGRLIIASPVDKTEPYDLVVDFDLISTKSEHYHFEAAALTQDHYIQTPFQWDGQAKTMQWQARIRITWRGVEIEQDFTSSLLFPTISTWHGVFYNPAEVDLSLDQVLDDQGMLNPALDWMRFSLLDAPLDSLSQPFGLRLTRLLKDMMPVKGHLAGYLATTIDNEQESPAVLFFQGDGILEFFMNGEYLEIDALSLEELQHLPFRPLPFLKEVRKVTLQLKRGANYLVVRTRPLPKNPAAWYLGAALWKAGGHEVHTIDS